MERRIQILSIFLICLVACGPRPSPAVNDRDVIPDLAYGIVKRMGGLLYAFISERGSDAEIKELGVTVNSVLKRRIAQVSENYWAIGDWVIHRENDHFFAKFSRVWKEQEQTSLVVRFEYNDGAFSLADWDIVSEF